MSVYTSVTNTELTHFLSRYNCGDLISYQGILDGISNTNFHLTTTIGEFIVTIYEQIDSTNLTAILSLQQHLNKVGFSCARVFCNNTGQLMDKLADKPASIVEKLDGTINYPVTSNLCQQIGLTLARFHVAAADVELPVENPRGSAWISEISKKLMQHLSSQDRIILQQELDYLSRYSKLSLPAGAIHADLFPDNVLVKDDAIIGIVDFELSCYDSYLFDLCICINAWCSQKDGQLDRYRMRDLLQAYISIRPLTQDENIAIPVMLRASALRFWLSRLNDVIFPTIGELTFNKDPEEFKSILLARRQRLSGMQR